MRRFAIPAHWIALAALGCAALACSVPLDVDGAATPSPTAALSPTSVIALPTATNAPPSITPRPVSTGLLPPTTVLGATMTPQTACSNDAEFVTDVSIPDGTTIVPGATFDKIWEIKNTGTCAWDGSYRLKQTSNTSVQAVTKEIPLPPVEPGASIQIGLKATLSADAPPGAKSTAVFELRDPADKKFGTKLTIEVVAVLPGTEQGSASGSIKGTVWNDFCHPGNSEGGGEPDGGQCISSPPNGKIGDGIFQTEEKGIGGVKVELRQNTCDGALVSTVTTDSKGGYSFDVLSNGKYCVLINALDADNASILIPGGWSHPLAEEGIASLSVTLGPDSMSASKINFGWDHQFD